MKSFTSLLFVSGMCAFLATGCGLLLDTQPRDTDPVDSGVGRGDTGSPECVTDDQCDDFNVCNGEESCVSGSCVGEDIVLDCGDGVSCTVDDCDPQFGCFSVPDDRECDADQFCFPDIGCAGELPCDDAHPCPRVDRCHGPGFACVQGFCEANVPQVVCQDQGQCLKALCANSTCLYVPDSSLCNNGAGCAESTCQSDGMCARPEPEDDNCDDGIDCTVDYCDTSEDENGICAATLDHGFCDDGVDCTINVCAPNDPTAQLANSGGCAIRFNDDVCAPSGTEFECAAPICLPSGCDRGVALFGCPTGSVCDVEADFCEFPETEEDCLRLGSPCAPATWNVNGFCMAPPISPCAVSVSGLIGFCDISQDPPACASRPDPQLLPPIDIIGGQP